MPLPGQDRLLAALVPPALMALIWSSKRALAAANQQDNGAGVGA